MSAEHAIRMPGRVLSEFAAMATMHIEKDSDTDLCEAISRAQVKPKGAGYTAIVPVPFEDVARLAAWVHSSTPKFMRDYADRMTAYANGDEVV